MESTPKLYVERAQAEDFRWCRFGKFGQVGVNNVCLHRKSYCNQSLDFKIVLTPHVPHRDSDHHGVQQLDYSVRLHQ